VSFKWSDRSLKEINSCHVDLRRVLHRALELSPIDIIALQGHRSVEEQQRLYREGRSKINGIDKLSKHNHAPSEAIDIAPYPIDWNDRERFGVLAGVMFSAAALEGVELRWGGDWDSDGFTTDHSFSDLPHFELVL